MQPSHTIKNSTEWVALHASYEQAERFSLLIKLIAIIVTAILVALNMSALFTGVLICVFWLQDAIWKTFQSRTEQRLLLIENAQETNYPRFYSHWEDSRPDTVTLLKSYIGSAFRPTVAYPYPVLIMLSIATMQLS